MEELDRLAAALILVQGDLNRTLRADAPRLKVVLVEEFGPFVADVSGAYCGGCPSLYGPTDEDALFSVAEATQDHLAELERLVWPVCPTHNHGVHVRSSDLGPPVWWCRGGEGHDLDPIGQLAQSGRPGPKSRRRRKRSWSEG